MLVRILVLTVFLFVIPTLAGGCFRQVGVAGVTGDKVNIPFCWVSGQMLLWAVFQLVSVPLILLQQKFRYVVILFGILAGVLACFGLVCLLRCFRKNKGRQAASGEKATGERSVVFLWLVFAVILVFQLVQAIRMTYGDGDDAYYVAVSTITETSDTMYRVLPYTGGTTGVDVRHGLAPFPIWIAFLARVCGIRTVSVAHIAVPVALIAMTYAIFYLLGSILFRGKRGLVPLFLIFTEILVIFGDYSFYTMENFMIARSRQGKAALGSIVIPMLFLLLFLLFERMQQEQDCGLPFWLLLGCTMTAGCLCTTVGTFLECMLLSVAGACGAISYRRYKVLLPLAACCAPCLVYILLYMLAS